MNREEFNKSYDELFPLYERLLKNVLIVIEEQLANEKLPFLNLNGRIKSLDSSFEKVDRKKYINPFDEVEDFCGVRIICYYPSDVDKIVSLLRKEFHVHSEEDTQTRLKPNEFGYRSTHLILSIPGDWLKVPQYRGLDNIKAEIQVRTILMHAWAEIQHKLAYKSADQVPDEFQRRLFRLSAKFEEADEQLEDIRDGLADYRKEIKPNSKLGLDGLRGLPLNLDTLSILLDTAYPEKKKSETENATLLNELLENSLIMDDLINAITAHDSIIAEFEQDERYGDQVKRWVQAGALRHALDVANEVYYQSRLSGLYDTPEWRNPVEFARALFEKPDS
jgi:putative GTP pyrophosphokinase